MSKLKLYVVGETSSNPDDWSCWNELQLVIAQNPEQARKLCEFARHQPVTEILFDKPKYLIGKSEPNHGADI